MKFSPQLKMNIGKVAVITACYILFNLFIAFYNIAMYNSPFSLGPSELFDGTSHIEINLLVGLIAGIFGGATLVLVNGQLFRRKSFRFAMLTTAGAYILIFVIITVFVTLFSVRAEFGNQVFS
jgi:adenylate cyclase